MPRRTAIIFIYPGFTGLELCSVQYFLAGIPHVVSHVAAYHMAPIAGDTGIYVMPTCDFATAPTTCDVLFVPGGGPGVVAAMRDPSVIAFIRSRAAHAELLLGLCSGVLILGAAGLLRGRRATSHWLLRDRLLARLGAHPVADRLVEDGLDLITAAGVTAGIDLGLAATRRLAGAEYAAKLELLAELPGKNGTDTGSAVGDLQTMFSPFIAQAEAAADAARTAWPAVE